MMRPHPTHQAGPALPAACAPQLKSHTLSASLTASLMRCSSAAIRVHDRCHSPLRATAVAGSRRGLPIPRPHDEACCPAAASPVDEGAAAAPAAACCARAAAAVVVFMRSPMAPSSASILEESSSRRPTIVLLMVSKRACICVSSVFTWKGVGCARAGVELRGPSARGRRAGGEPQGGGLSASPWAMQRGQQGYGKDCSSTHKLGELLHLGGCADSVGGRSRRALLGRGGGVVGERSWVSSGHKPPRTRAALRARAKGAHIPAHHGQGRPTSVKVVCGGFAPLPLREF